MKGIILSFVLLLSTILLQAQEVTIEGVSARGFSGVKSINGEFYYTFYFGEKTDNKGMANFILAIYDQNLTSIKNTEIEISKNSELAASAFNGQYFLFIFADLSKKKRTMVTLDKNGSIIKQTVEEDVRAALLTPDNYPDVHGVNQDEFVIVRPEKEKKFGYEIQRVDKDLTIKWTTSFFPEKGIWSIEDSKLAATKLILLRKEKANALMGDKHTYSVQSLNLETGDAIYTTALVNEDDGAYPDFIRVDEKGEVATGGMYFKDGKYDDKNSDGLFFALIAPNGSISKFSKSSWKKVKDQIKGDFSSDLFGGRTKVLVEDIIQKLDGNYMVIGETWRKSNSADNTGTGAIRKLGGFGGGSTSTTDSKDKGFTLMDFAFFNFDATGELSSIDKVEKTTKEAVIKGALADEHGLAMAQTLYKRKFFCYRNTIEFNNKQYVMFKNDDGFKTKAYFLPVGATSVSGIGSIDMDKWVPEGLNKLGKFTKMTGGNKYTFGNTDNVFETSNPELYKNIIPAKPGFVLLYQFFNGKLALWLQQVPQ